MGYDGEDIEAAMNQHALLDDALEALVWDNGQSFAYQNAKDELRVAARALAHVRLIAERWVRG